MRYYAVRIADAQCLVAETESAIYNLTGAHGGIRRFRDLASAASIVGCGIDDVAGGLLDDAPELDRSALTTLERPIAPDEIWAAGVTYKISEEARGQESSMPEMYVSVYNNDRPEIFFKATSNHTVGPDDDVGIRGDSTWDVPEPELGVVLYRGDPVGYTIGNDVSSREIEGENPLYLPQAKVYARCCSLGPSVASQAVVDDPHDLRMDIKITRDGDTMYADETSTSEMVRSCEELVSYYTRHNSVPELAVLLTGTALVPDEEFSLAPGDDIVITLEEVGTLHNHVRRV